MDEQRYSAKNRLVTFLEYLRSLAEAIRRYRKVKMPICELGHYPCLQITETFAVSQVRSMMKPN
jgi:hypothetical protein